MVFPPGEFITSTPRRVAAWRSTLSTPTPARPMTLRFLAASITSAVIWLPLRTRIAWYGATFFTSSAGGSAFSMSSVQPSERRISAPRSVMPSRTSMRTLNACSFPSR